MIFDEFSSLTIPATEAISGLFSLHASFTICSDNFVPAINTISQSINELQGDYAQNKASDDLVVVESNPAMTLHVADHAEIQSTHPEAESHHQTRPQRIRGAPTRYTDYYVPKSFVGIV